MNPKTLKKGDAVNIAGPFDDKARLAFFVRRQLGEPGRQGECYFRVPEFAGLCGPDDTGIAVLSDRQVRARVYRAEATA
jgi:hypothetical protein